MTDNTMTNRKGTNNDLQNITHETKDRAKRISKKKGKKQQQKHPQYRKRNGF